MTVRTSPLTVLLKGLMGVLILLLTLRASAQDDIYLKQPPTKAADKQPTKSATATDGTSQPLTDYDPASQTAPIAKVGLALLMRTGFTNNGLLDNMNFSNVERQITPGFCQFAGVRLLFTGGQAVTVEAGFQQRLYRRVIKQTGQQDTNYTETATINSLTIPIRYQYVWVNTDRVFLSADLGLDVNLAQDGNLTITTNRGVGSYFSPVGDLIARTEICNSIGLSAGFRIAPRLFLEGNLALVTGMTSLNNGLYKLNNGSQYATFTRATLFTLGLRYQLYDIIK